MIGWAGGVGEGGVESTGIAVVKNGRNAKSEMKV